MKYKLKQLSLILLILLSGCTNNNKIEATRTPFPEITGTDMQGNTMTNDIFSEYKATIVNFWNNGCGTCIEEMPDLEAYYQEFKSDGINLIGVASDSGESKEQFNTALKILNSKNVTYINLSPDINSDFYKEFIGDITGYPITYIVDADGQIVGAPIIGNVKNQEDVLKQRLDLILNQ